MDKLLFSATALIVAVLFWGLAFDTIQFQQHVVDREALDWRECGYPCEPIDPPVRSRPWR